MILVDTSVWSLALRRASPTDDPRSHELRRLIERGQAAIIGAVRQELLSGVKVEKQFELLKARLREFPDIVATTEDHEEAARLFNRCRARGVQGSNTDFLICAMALRHDMPIFTVDQDFTAFAPILRVKLHGLRASARSNQ